MGSVISFYEQLVGTEDDRERMRLIAEALERLEHRPLPETVATGAQLRETELRLQKEIEQVRHETELVRAELKQDIAELRTETEKIRAELKQDIAELRTETEKIRAELKQDIEQVRAEVARSKAETVKWMAGLLALQATAIVAALAGIMAGML